MVTLVYKLNYREDMFESSMEATGVLLASEF